MGRMPAKIEHAALIFFVFSGLFMPRPAYAYVDPGTSGLLTQMLYILFYGALGVFFYCLRNIKQFLTKAKRYIFVNFLKGKTKDHDQP